MCLQDVASLRYNQKALQEDTPTRIALLGSTGSIGTQALEVIAANPGRFEVAVLAARSRVELLIEQARKFQPDIVVIADKSKYAYLKDALADLPIKVYTGDEAIEQVMDSDGIDTVLTAMVGFSGLRPTVRAIQNGKTIALANKETLVVAGHIINKLLKEHKAALLPIDSEHSAIFQCLQGEWNNPLEKVILTASGGPCRGMNKEQLQHITPQQALKHPNWSMGAKITIDSATLMNKGLEVIEARWLFGLKPAQIEVIVHPQSIIHSLVQFKDGSLKAQMGMPDMKLPIQYALGYPLRLPVAYTQFDFMNYPTLTFEKPDLETFTCLPLAFEAMQRDGNMPCVLNAANEVAVQAFLDGKIGFVQISELISTAMQKVAFIKEASLEDLYATDTEARRITQDAIA